MRFQEERKNKKVTIIAMGGLVLIPITLISLLFRVNYLEAKNKFNALGQTPKGAIQPVTATDYITGNPQAKVTLVEYSDFECPQCQYFHPTLNKLLAYYGNKIRLVSRRYPLPQNQNAEKEAEAALCAGKVGGNSAFWKFSEKIFAKVAPTEGGTGLSLSLLPEFAKTIGINQKKFQTCLDNGKVAIQVQSEEWDGTSAGVYQLPGTFVIDPNGHAILLSGNQSFAVMKDVIDQALSL